MNGNRTSLRKRDGVTIAYAYDASNRVVQKIVPASASGAAGYGVVYGYDNRGLETSARFGADSGPGVTDSYDNAGRLVAATTTMDGAARTLSATYDADGNRTGLTGPWGYTAGFAYDGLDRLWGTSESGYPTTQLTYDAAGRRAGLASGFGTMTSSASSLYDAAGRLQVHAHDLAGTAADQSVTFGYNPASQITSEARTNEAYASNTAYNVNRSYAANGLNQYMNAGSAQLAYDANGNLAASPAGDGGTVAYVYDAENRLVSATTSGGTGGTRVVTLSYDPNGRLWQVAAPSGTTRFVYDGDQILIEADGAGNLLRAYVHGTAEDEPLLWYEALPGGASRRFLHADHQGSIVAVADQDGNSLAIDAYDAWGIPNAGNIGRFGYTGQAWLPELGMWYYKARIYSPTLGRFLQVDPIGYKDQVNLYVYVRNDPLGSRDPTGRFGDPGGDILGEVIEGVSSAAKFTAERVAGGLIMFLTPSPAGVEDNPETEKRITFLERRVYERMNVVNSRHIDAALRESRGEVVARRPDGKPFDHINELREARAGLMRDIRALKAQFGHDIGEDQGSRLRAALGRASRMLDTLDRVLDRVDSNCNTAATRLCSRP